MHLTLRQRDSFKTIRMTITHSGVQVYEETLNKKHDSFVPFENISNEVFHMRRFRQWAILLTMVFGVFAAIGLWAQTTPQVTGSRVSNSITLVVLFLVPLLIMWFTRKEFTGFGVSNNAFLVRANKPSREEVHQFLQVLSEAKIGYLRETYFEQAKYASPEEELRNLIWLRKQQAISQDEFENRKQKIDMALASAPETRGDSVTLHYEGRPEYITATAKYLAKSNPAINSQLFRAQVGATVIITVILAGAIYALNGRIRFNDALFILIWLIISYFFSGYITKYNYVKRFSSIVANSTSKSLITRNISISVNDREIAFSSDIGTSKLQRSAIQQIDEDGNYVYITLSGTSVITIPKNAFASETHQRDFIAMICSHISGSSNTKSNTE
jgi:hypothetical protein